MRLKSLFALTIACALLLGAAVWAESRPAGQDLTVFAADGIRLQATYWSAGKPGPGVLLLHMCNSDRKAWFGLGPMLAARGIHALALDYRGYGESGGQQSQDSQVRQRTVNEIWPSDVDAAFELLKSKLGVKDPLLGAAGGSCGVNQSIQLARRHPEVRTLALLAGGTNPAGEDFLGATSWMPLLGVAARDDGGAVAMTRWVLGFSSHSANEFKEYADGGHGTAIFAVHKDLEPAIADWFERHLIRQPVRAQAPTRNPVRGPSAKLWASFREPGGVAAARAELHAAAARGERLPFPPEGAINGLGYELLQNGNSAQAIELFELNVELHPESVNTYDSLADGYVAAGKRDLALATVEKGFKLLSTDPALDADWQTALREALAAKLKELRKAPGG